MSEWRRRGTVRGALAALAACALAGCLLPARTAVAAPDAEAAVTLERTVRFLQEAQNLDGGFGGRRGGVSDPDFSAWAAYALAAAGINPQDQSQPGGVDVFSYLAANTAELEQTTDFDRVALVALASGTSPYAFGAVDPVDPVDPVDAILARQLPDGSFPQREGLKTGWINSTIWSIFPLSALHTPAAEAAVHDAGQWLLAQQRPDGSWGGTIATSAADTDTVGAALQALVAAGLRDAEAERRAFEYLATVQGPDGGFRESAGGPTNSATTAWVVQGMWATGVDPREWRTDAGGDPLSFIASLQRSDGSIGWTADNDTNSLWMAAQCGPALAGMTYPLAAVPRAKPPPERSAPHRRRAHGHHHRAAERGHGGKEATPGDGVIAGGGGRGAPLFSAPQPQSAGSIPHGARQLQAAPSAVGSGARSGPGGGAPSSPAPRSPEAAGTTVEGLLVGERGGGPAAPGLFGADSGGRPEPLLVAALLAALAASATLGSRRERGGVEVS